MKYRPTIGLEVHAELKTATKMFCACKNDTDETRPNVNICPICMGHPGTLPTMNKEAVRSVLKVGLALGGRLAFDFSEFDRKNYFYPDIPKAYQISQYKYPLVSGGELNGVAITRVHLEEDTASSSHDGGFSLVDFNRAGLPLMELVTEPVLHSGEEVMRFGEELQLLFQYLGVSTANMEKGEMRLEANISISDSDKLGTKVEVKNLNSFKAAQKAIQYEIERQTELLEKGEKVAQETRGFNEKSQTTFSQRTKEDSHDYRYFPDPDLPKLVLKEAVGFDEAGLKEEMLETPNQKRERFGSTFGVKGGDIEVYVHNKILSNIFEKASVDLDKKYLQTLSNCIVSEVAKFGDEASSFSPSHLASLSILFADGQISSRGMKDILEIMRGDDRDPSLIAKEHGLFQKSDEGELLKMVDKILEANLEAVSEYNSGKLSALQYLVGKGMQESKGAANPQILKSLFEKRLSK